MRRSCASPHGDYISTSVSSTSATVSQRRRRVAVRAPTELGFAAAFRATSARPQRRYAVEQPTADGNETWLTKFLASAMARRSKEAIRRASASTKPTFTKNRDRLPRRMWCERQHHRNRQAPAERHRRTHHAAQRLRPIAIVPGDDRMHLRLGQTARHDAQNKTSRHNQGHHRFHAQSDRLQPDPHSQIADGLADSAHNHPVAPRVRRQKDRTSATLEVLQMRQSAGSLWIPEDLGCCASGW